MQRALVQAVFTGQPQSIEDAGGSWTSSIFRTRQLGALAVTEQGIAGDRVAQPYHGGPDAAVCVHLADHYAFWAAAYQLRLAPGSFGENVVLADLQEDQVSAGDLVRLGSALVQVSGPRVPCANLARRIGRPDWVRLTVRENRTGFYLRVLEPGILQQGATWTLQERLNEDASLSAINRCMYGEFHAEYATAMLQMRGLSEWWKKQARQKLSAEPHWTSTMMAE